MQREKAPQNVSEYILEEIQVSYTPKLNIKRNRVDTSLLAFEILRLLYRPEIISLREEFHVLYLNTGNYVLGSYHHSTGGISTVVVDVRHIIAVALKCNASALIISHNHPSGKLNASVQDKLLTKKLNEACEIFDLALMDHIIVTPSSYFSFADEGLL